MRTLLFGGRGGASAGVDIGLLALRVFAGLSLCLTHGLNKVPPADGFIANVGRMGFPLPGVFAWAAGLSEVVGGFMLALGLLTRPSALFVGVTMTVAAFWRHGADPFERKELALLYLAVAVVFVFAGSGRFGLDRWITKPTRRP